MDLKSKIILIYGPTASGKSDFALKLAKEKGINLLKIYFTQANKRKAVQDEIEVDHAVILGFKFPSQITTLKRK